jgi:hypothetical protein
LVVWPYSYIRHPQGVNPRGESSKEALAGIRQLSPRGAQVLNEFFKCRESF